MRAINLSRRPFVNRRPVLRLAILLWIVGAALAVLNFRQYAGHWEGTSINRQRLATVDERFREERAKLVELDRELAQVKLGREKRHAAFLNQLIAFRTFPWSALFDDLEDVVPLDVKLFSVRPDVKLKAEPQKTPRPRRARPRPAAAARRTATVEAEPGDSAAASRGAGTSRREEERPLMHGEVRLQLAGLAKSEDALVEFIEVLYTNPYFRAPFRPGEIFESNGNVRFTLSAIYQTRRRDVSPEAAAEGPAGAGVVASQPSAEEGSGLSPSSATGSGVAQAASGSPEQIPAAEAGAAAPGSGAGSATGMRAQRSAAEAAGDRRPASRRNQASAGSPAGPRAPETGAPDTGAAGEESASRSSRPAVPRSRIRPRANPGALPGATLPGVAPGAQSPGSTGAASSSRPAPPGQPGFVQPAASGTP